LFPLLFGIGIGLLGRFSFLQLGADRGLTKADDDTCDGSIAGKRKSVSGLQHFVALRATIGKNLNQPKVSQGAKDHPMRLRAQQGYELTGFS